MFRIFRQCWLGEASLAKAFWVVYVLYNLILITIIDFIIDYFVAGSFTPFYIHNRFLDMIITLAFPYLFISAMCVWVSGKNSARVWNILSKIVVLIPLIIGSFHLTRVI